MADPIKGLLRFGRAVFDRIEETMKRVADDPAVQAALEADLGLPPGSLDAAKEERQPLTGIEEYIEEANPSAAQLEVAFDAIQSYVRFWTTVFKAAKTEDPSVVVDEVLYRLLETTTVDLVRMEYPTFYAVMRLLRVF
jgi:hypothetical protein